MRSYHVIAITAVILIMLLTAQDVCSFTVHRPRKPVKPSPTNSMDTTVPTVETTETNEQPVNNYSTGGQPGGGGTGPDSTATTAVKPPVPSPTPSVYVPSRSKFPVFVLGMTLFLLFGVMVWYYTRNVNFRRLFK